MWGIVPIKDIRVYAVEAAITARNGIFVNNFVVFVCRWEMTTDKC